MKCIAIDGRGGSGKTYLANALAEKLGAPVLHLDDFGNDYEPFVGIPKLLEILDSQTADTVIYEGVGVLDNRFDRFGAFKILVDTPPDVRKARAEGRDVPRADRSAEEWENIYTIWKEAEARYFTNDIAHKADLVMTDTGESEVNQILLALRS